MKDPSTQKHDMRQDPDAVTAGPPSDRNQPPSTASLNQPLQPPQFATNPNVSPDDNTVVAATPAAGDGPFRPNVGGTVELGRSLEGERLGHFHLEQFIGSGGMGAVFRGTDEMLGRTVAIKVLSPTHGADEETTRRFRHEAQSTARLDHDNIARVYYVGKDRGWYYIVLEYVEGQNLRDIVAANGPLTFAEVIHYTIQIAEALHHASSRDVVHRDIKPSNVLITSTGQAKLVDMGLARLHQVEQQDSDLTSSGVTLGTFDYISPEQAFDPRSADVRSDLYSLGCTVYYMLTGRPPFPEGNMLQKLMRHQREVPPDPREMRPDIPAGLSDLTNCLLAKNPDDRYQTPRILIAAAMEVADALDLPMPEQRSDSRIVRIRRAPSRLRQHLPWAIPVAALLLIVLVIYILGLSGRAEPSVMHRETPVRAIAATSVVEASEAGVAAASDSYRVDA